MKKTSKLWLIVPPLAFFLKDIVATNAILATEPGITREAKYYYSLALLPGSLLVDDATGALLGMNVLFGLIVGLILFICLRFLRRRNPTVSSP